MDAARNETEPGSTVTFEWRGESITIPASLDDADIDVMEAFEDGKAVKALRAILGTRQYDKLKESQHLKGSDFKELSDAVAREMGFGSSGE